MKVIPLFAAGALLVLGACTVSDHGRERVAVGVTVAPGYYDGYYDGHYGAFSDGYWGDDGAFYYYDSNHTWQRDNDHHFRRDASDGFVAVHGSGVHRDH
jgi:hypothetical protein